MPAMAAFDPDEFLQQQKEFTLHPVQHNAGNTYAIH